jgi:hypothetical protein
MPHPIREQLRPIVEAIEIVSPAAFRYRGKAMAVPPGPVTPIPGLPAHPLPQTPLVRELQQLLYTRCYAQPFDDESELQLPLQSDPSFVQRLSAANRSRARWEAGWTVYSVAAAGQVYLQKGDRQRSAMAGEYLTAGPPGMPPQPGVQTTVASPRDSAIAQPGFYFLYGETLSDLWDEHHLLRFYFHATAVGVGSLLEYLTGELNRFQVPFRMKALIEPALYRRTDAVVLYLARRYHAIAVRIVRGMPREVAAGLRPASPLFTLELARGVGLAEEPNTGESFGMHRCRMTADGLVEAWKAGKRTTDARIDAIGAQFKQAGFQLDMPYLSPSSTDLVSPPERVEFAHA